MTFELNPDYVSMLPKFMRFEDPYLFIREFEEVCWLIHMPRVLNDVVRIKFIPFALKDDAKRWMYCVKIGSIKSWDYFVDIFLKRYFPIARPLELGMKSFLLSNLKMSLFGSI